MSKVKNIKRLRFDMTEIKTRSSTINSTLLRCCIWTTKVTVFYAHDRGWYRLCSLILISVDTVSFPF